MLEYMSTRIINRTLLVSYFPNRIDVFQIRQGRNIKAKQPLYFSLFYAHIQTAVGELVHIQW